MAVRVFMNGCCGRMGRAINEMCLENPTVDIVAGCDLADNTNGLDFPVFKNLNDCDVDFDVIIDFSNSKCIPALFEFACAKKKPVVCCTTGLSDEDMKILDDASKVIPVFKSANMSLGMNIMVELCKKATKFLYPEYDIEIVEAHHNKKLDAPSGTALMIADAIKSQIDTEIEYVFDRSDVRKMREKKEIGISAIRGGNIVGEHEAMFIGGEEILKISHSAQTRLVFARGSIAAAKFVVDKEPGKYDMSCMINF